MNLSSFPLRLLLLALLALPLMAACDRCGQSAEEERLPWKYESDAAPYELVFPSRWVAEPPGSINPHADVAASRDDTFFFMVIPQELPTFPNPDVFELKRVALEMLDQSVEQFVIERQGPLELDGESGLTVFASGQLEGEAIQYITSYVIHEGIGFQIIAFTDHKHSAELFAETDEILSTWQFTEQATNSVDEPSVDGESPAPEQNGIPAPAAEPPDEGNGSGEGELTP